MKRLWELTGRSLYFMAQPFIFLIVFGSQRTRIVVQCGNSIVVVKDWLGNGAWKLPGGGVHRGERAVMSAVRELREETGLIFTSDQLMKLTGIVSNPRSKISYSCFYAKLPSKPRLRPKGEIIDICWMPIDELLTKPNISINTRAILGVLSRGK